ncbi:MAG TPA: metallophosphoesterase, partial [Gemmatimonadales bacterium]|nr:metallophosphoesterase [Gemmatimonadales bacterium]
MRRRASPFPLALLALVTASASLAAQARPIRFVVLGHVRGDPNGPNPRLAELLDRVREVRPSLVLLTGDMIWGDMAGNPSDTAWLNREWRHLDSSLATLGVPVLRVPGNHDISDLASRDVYRERYGLPPQAVTAGRNRFILLSSAWIPADGDTRKAPYTRPRELDSVQVAFLRAELARRDRYDHVFVAMHHLLWWEPDSSQWWRVVHPLLVRGRVDAVFSGDYGPMKFSTLSRDGVRYFQTSIENTPALEILRNRIASRLLSSQFDNFLEVRLDGGEPEYRVHTVAEISSGEFTPERWKAINEAPPTPESAGRRLLALVRSPRRVAVLLVFSGLVFAAGWAAGSWRRAGRPR